MARSSYPWTAFREVMSHLAKENEGRVFVLYEFVELYDAFVGTFVHRPHGLNTDRPQDYLSCILLVRSFRLLIGGLLVVGSGYSDLGPNLGRTIWEIAVRLLYSQKDPVAAAFGFFLHAKGREIGPMETELAYCESKGISVGHLRENLKNAKDNIVMMERIAISKGVSPAEAVKCFGKLNIRQACQEIGVEKAYLVDYSYESGHVHERNLTTDSFMKRAGNVAKYEVGPINEQAEVWATTGDLLRNFGLVASSAGTLVQDSKAREEANNLLERLNRELEKSRG